MVIPIATPNLSDQQRAWFYAEYREAEKEEIVGVLLALFLGGFGLHRFYLGQTGAGILYLVFSWTGIPTLVAFVECFFMPSRVRAYNAAQAQYIMAGILATSPQSLPHSTPPAFPSPLPIANDTALVQVCPACGGSISPGASFCPHCGKAMAAGST